MTREFKDGWEKHQVLPTPKELTKRMCVNRANLETFKAPVTKYVEIRNGKRVEVTVVNGVRTETELTLRSIKRKLR